jgi:ribosomal protein S18 acetylase RimI-like enzyme
VPDNALPAMDQIVIRPARTEDTPGMARLVDTYRVAHRGQVPDHVLDAVPLDQAYAESERNWRRTVAEIAATRHPREQVFVAVERLPDSPHPRVVGAGMGGPRGGSEEALEPYAGEVYTLYVATTHQRRGIGRRLLCAIVRHLVDAGMPSVVVGSLTANAPARRFYDAMGGRAVHERTIDEGGVLLQETLHGWLPEDVSRLLSTHAPGHGRPAERRS